MVLGFLTKPFFLISKVLEDPKDINVFPLKGKKSSFESFVHAHFVNLRTKKMIGLKFVDIF